MQQIRTIDIKGRPYVTVAERVRLAHETRESFEVVESTPMQVGERWIWRAVVQVDGRQYIGHAEVKMNAKPGTADATDPFACAETSAIGRCFGFAGLGAIESIASADEIVRAEVPCPERIVAPRETASVHPTSPTTGKAEQPVSREPQREAETLPKQEPGRVLLPGQFNALKMLYLKRNEPPPPDLASWSEQRAREAIKRLQGQKRAS